MRGPYPKGTASSRIAKTSGDYTVIGGQCKFERGVQHAASQVARSVWRPLGVDLQGRAKDSSVVKL